MVNRELSLINKVQFQEINQWQLQLQPLINNKKHNNNLIINYLNLLIRNYLINYLQSQPLFQLKLNRLTMKEIQTLMNPDCIKRYSQANRK